MSSRLCDHSRAYGARIGGNPRASPVVSPSAIRKSCPAGTGYGRAVRGCPGLGRCHQEGARPGMIKYWTFGRRLAIGFGLAAITLLLVAALSYRVSATLIENETAVRHAYDVRAQFTTVLSELKDAETGQRGYLLTGDPAYLAPYQAVTGVRLRTAIRRCSSSLPIVHKANGSALRLCRRSLMPSSPSWP